jgi:hypothetical protein
VDKYIDLPYQFENNLYYLRASADFTLTFDDNLNLILTNDQNGINIDITVGTLPNNTEILVKNTYLNYNYSAYQDLKYGILQVKYYTKILDRYGYEYIYDNQNNFRYIVVGNIYKRLFLLTNTNYETYLINNNIHLSQFENGEIFNDLIDKNNALYVITENHEEYIIKHYYEFKLDYSDISAETLNITGFNKFKETLDSDTYDMWLQNLIGD